MLNITLKKQRSLEKIYIFCPLKSGIFGSEKVKKQHQYMKQGSALL